MEKSAIRVLILFLLMAQFSVSNILSAQVKDSTLTGIANGIVKDSTGNYMLQSATLAIYKSTDSSLLAYVLSNNLGEFKFKGLPVDISLKLVVSYVGYQPYSHTFNIPGDKGRIDLKTIFVKRENRKLNEIVITAYKPPVQFKGDTLEFNADAFKLDSNAVVEDLLRKLPGITIWGDGKITVNGKQVRNVFVDNKPFFGNDARIATQNIPKDAVEKVQVYREKPKENEIDSILDINIALKKNRRNGVFGKIGGGYGTNKRFEGDIMLSLFSPRSQLSIVAATNNVNKLAGNAATLMQNASYKGIGASIEYQPDFNTQGQNQSNAGGFTYHHDFIDNSTYNNRNGVDADYFAKNINSDILSATQTTTSLGGDSGIIQKNNNSTHSINTTQRLHSKYEWIKDQRSFFVSSIFSANDNYNRSEITNSSENTRQVSQSTNNSFTENDIHTNGAGLETVYSSQRANNDHSRLPKSIKINYSLNIDDTRNEQTRKNKFVSLLNTGENQDIDRKYNSHLSNLNQKLFVKIGDLKKVIFNEKKLSNINISFENALLMNLYKESNIVTDIDTSSKNYRPNNYLTNYRRNNTINETPQLNIQRSFNKTLVNRYMKTTHVTLSAAEQFLFLQSISQKNFQTFSRNYKNFLPAGAIEYNNNQLGDYQDIYSLRYGSLVDYPTADQIAPLVDSSNIYYRQLGNHSIQPAYKRSLNFRYQHINTGAKNDFNYLLDVTVGNASNYVTDSSAYDNLGRSVHYAVNAGGYKYLTMLGEFRKNYKFHGNQIQLMAASSYNLATAPFFVNENHFFSDNSTINGNIGISYTLNDLLAVSLEQKLQYYRASQSQFSNGAFKNSIQSSSVSASVNCTKKLTTSSNLTYNKSTSTGFNTVSFTIWNVSACYRFLKGNKGEVKISALDVLHQNRSIINYGENNNLTTGRVTVMQQYFMLTFSYFIRKFGAR
jgi:Outer membrane protein beta-barrel family